MGLMLSGYKTRSNLEMSETLIYFGSKYSFQQVTQNPKDWSAMICQVIAITAI